MLEFIANTLMALVLVLGILGIINVARGRL